VCKHGDRWKAFRSHLGTGRVDVYNAELWAIRLALQESVKKKDTADTRSNEGSCLQRLASSHSTNGAPESGARAASGQVDQPEREDSSQGRH
jgi:hypothetical protein